MPSVCLGIVRIGIRLSMDAAPKEIMMCRQIAKVEQWARKPGWGLQPPALHPRWAEPAQGRQSVAEEVEKIEKVVRFGAFWCILMRATSDKMSEIGACLLP